MAESTNDIESSQSPSEYAGYYSNIEAAACTTDYANTNYQSTSGEEYPSEFYGGEQQQQRPPIVRPGYDAEFYCNVNTLNKYSIHDVYLVDLDGPPLAGGGFGSVFKGYHLFMEDFAVAIKEIDFEVSHNREIDHETLVREMDTKVAEIAVLKEFRNCHNMVHLHEYFVNRIDQASQYASLYIVTEFLEGGELFGCIVNRYKQQRHNAFTEADVRDIFRVLMDAVDFMHKKNVVHRDLKPSNLLLQIPDYPLSLKVADFGQSKKLEPGEKTLTVCGTPGYRPPEIWERKPYDFSVDLFSSGVILFFMLAGYQPFSCYKKHQIPHKTIQCEYKADRESWRRTSQDAQSLVRNLLTKPDRRYTIEKIFKHKWMKDDDCTRLKYDLTENYRGLEQNMQHDEALKEPKVNAGHGASPLHPYFSNSVVPPSPSATPRRLSSTRLLSQTSFVLDDASLALSDDHIPLGTRPLLQHILGSVEESQYTERVARRYCRMMLTAVARLHANNVVHRNITFPNLLVASGGESILFRGMSHATNIEGGEGDSCLTGYCGTPYRSTAPEVYSDFMYNEVSAMP